MVDSEVYVMLSLLLASLPLVAQPPGEVHPTRLLVKPEPARPASEVRAVEAAAGARLLRDLPAIGWRILELPAGRLEDARRALVESGTFERVDYDRRRRAAHVPDDPYWPEWHMQKIRADVAWDTTKGAPSVVVAVLDTGLDLSHPDLSANGWSNPGEVPGNGIDDDQNGYVDDVHGYDFAYDDGDPDDQYGHGTGCAGLIAAVQDNGIGVTGVAPHCRLAGVKVSTDAGWFYDSAIVPGLVYCADMGFQVVSMSFFSDLVTPAERDAIDYCWGQGVLPVAAAGNDASVLPYYPGAYENVLSVGSTGQSDGKSWFSNWGSWVDVAAPGEGLSTVSLGGGYTTGFTGTSGACPHVAGLAGLLFAAVPAATNAQVRAAIEDSALPLTQAPWGAWVNYGRVDCVDALARIQGQTSGSKPPRLLFASPCAGGLVPSLSTAGAHAPSALLVYGVGLESPNLVEVLRDGAALPLFSQQRNQVTSPLGGNFSNALELRVGGAGVATLAWDGGLGLSFAPSDAGTWGGGAPVALGGFEQLYRVDGDVLTCTRRDDGTIGVRLAIRKVFAPSLERMRLELVRSYVDVSGSETVLLYDWSTASYPYGSWVSVLNTPITGGASLTTRAAIGPDPARFVDDEGTVYVLITTTGAGPAGQLVADCLRVRVN